MHCVCLSDPVATLGGAGTCAATAMPLALGTTLDCGGLALLTSSLRSGVTSHATDPAATDCHESAGVAPD
jgi:hypothetical protein